MIKNIIFDFGGVIVHLDSKEACRRFISLGITDAEQQLSVFGQTGIFREVETGEITAEEFCRKLAAEAKAKGGKFKAEENPAFTFEQAQWAWLGYIKAVPQKNLETLLRLQKDYNLYLLSNLNPFISQWDESEAFSGDGHGLSHYIPERYYSFQLHDYKPAPSIFEKMLSLAGIKAEESVFLDDSPKNIVGCESVGIKGLLVQKDEDWTERLDAFLAKQNGL